MSSVPESSTVVYRIVNNGCFVLCLYRQTHGSCFIDLSSTCITSEAKQEGSDNEGAFHKLNSISENSMCYYQIIKGSDQW